MKSFFAKHDKARARGLLVAGVALIVLGMGLLAIPWLLSLSRRQPVTPLAVVTPSAVGERLIPSATAAPSRSAMPMQQSATPSTAATPVVVKEMLSATPTMADSGPETPTRSVLTPQETCGSPTLAPANLPVPSALPGLFSLRQRVGVVAPQSDIALYDVERLGAGWFLTGLTEQTLPLQGGMEFAPLVEVLGATYSPGAETLQGLARAQPGALWLVGNEPDVIWQDRATPEEYAQVFHEVYAALKSADPTAQIAIGGVSQVTPLRLRYLDGVLAAYREKYGEPMPVDVWNIHLAILREERGSWGVDIPPGLPDDTGILYEIGDNADVDILKNEVLTFRAWMAEQGLRDKPLIVTEFSVLMPPEYGFPPDKVQDFMTAAFDYMLTATDSDTGYRADGNRLVQRWAWYSIADRIYSTGNLFDPDTRQITSLGLAFAEYTASRQPGD